MSLSRLIENHLIKEVTAVMQRNTEMAKNEKMIELFNRGISEIDETLIKSGRNYING